MRVSYRFYLCIISSLILLLQSCGTSAPAIFGRKTLHEQYGQRISNAGLHETALGRSWFRAAEQSLGQPLTVSVPYSETGYFAAEKPRAVGLKFQAKRGEKLLIHLDKRPADSFAIYFDLWDAPGTGGKPKLLASGDTTGKPLEVEVKNEGSYILRIQPELLKGGEYSITISSGPSLAFPVSPAVKSHVGSFWGAGRDRGARKHEGIDIFAPFRTPALATANGVVTRVNENNLGGKVVWFRPENRDYTLYYAHLDTQWVADGQFVRAGDTLGLIGNTGNARTTAPHLHFGIYGMGGAVDPYPFVNPAVRTPARITASIANLGEAARSTGKRARFYDRPDKTAGSFIPLETNTLLFIEAATSGWYKAMLPNGQAGFISHSEIAAIRKPLRSTKLLTDVALLDQPDTTAARKTILPPGQSVDILAGYGDYYFIGYESGEQGWLPKEGVRGS